MVVLHLTNRSAKWLKDQMETHRDILGDTVASHEKSPYDIEDLVHVINNAMYTNDILGELKDK